MFCISMLQSGLSFNIIVMVFDANIYFETLFKSLSFLYVKASGLNIHTVTIYYTVISCLQSPTIGLNIQKHFVSCKKNNFCILQENIKKKIHFLFILFHYNKIILILSNREYNVFNEYNTQRFIRFSHSFYKL